MSPETGQVSSNNLGVLKGCLVEGDPEQQLRQRMVRRRALILSVAVQSIVVAAIVLVPLLGKPARIALANVTPVPPYYSRPAPRQATVAQAQSRRAENICRFCPGRTIPPNIVLHDPAPPNDGPGELIVDRFPGEMEPLLDTSTVPGPRPPDAHVDVPRVVRITHIDPAMLTHRVEPVYPTLPKQIGRSGRVELRAIIGTDGAIQSLEAVGGDPMFFQSALEAVRQWRYTPTLLNGQRVQLDTYITVIYNVRR
jgi:protein TonB